MTEDKKNLPEIFNLNPKTSEQSLVDSLDKLPEDVVTSRDALLKAIKQNEMALNEMVELAYASQHARYYEVLNGLLKTKGELAERLTNLHQQIRDIISTDNQAQGPTIVKNNNLIVTTAELLSMIKQAEQEEKVIDHDEGNT